MDSILDTIKKMLGIEIDLTAFDTDIIIHINTSLMSLRQLGIGPQEAFSISDNTKTWSDFFGEELLLEGAKTYIYLKVRLLFDPPTSSTVIEAINRQLLELEWRLNSQVELSLNNLLEGDLDE